MLKKDGGHHYSTRKELHGCLPGATKVRCLLFEGTAVNKT